MQNLLEKCTQWCRNGSKVAHFGPKLPFLGHKRLQTPQMAGKSGSNVGSHLNTCRRTNLGAKLFRKMHPVVWKWPQICPFGAKKSPHMCSTVIHQFIHFCQPSGASGASYGPNMVFLAPNWPLWGHVHTAGCVCLTSFASRMVLPHVYHCDPPFDPLLPAIWGVWSLLWPKMSFLAQNWPLLGHFHTTGCVKTTLAAETRIFTPF